MLKVNNMYLAPAATMSTDIGGGHGGVDLGSEVAAPSDGSNEAPPPPPSLLGEGAPSDKGLVPDVKAVSGDTKLDMADFGDKFKVIKKENDKTISDTKDGKKEAPTTEIKKTVVEETKKASTPVGRNYEELKQYGLDDAAIALHKNMSNDAYSFAVARYKDLKAKSDRVKELETQLTSKQSGDLPSSYYEHPEGHILDPKYSKAVGAINQTHEAKEYWKEQFALVRAGDNWKNIVQGADGKYVLREEKPSAQAEAEILGNINECDNNLNKLQGEVGLLKSQFKNRHEEIRRSISKYEDEFFPELKDPEKLKGNQYYNAIVDAFNSNGMGHLPTNGLFAKLYATHMDILGKYKALRAEKDKGAAIDTSKTLAGPSGNDTAGSGVAAKGDMLSMDEFAAVKRRV